MEPQEARQENSPAAGDQTRSFAGSRRTEGENEEEGRREDPERVTAGDEGIFVQEPRVWLFWYDQAPMPSGT